VKGRNWISSLFRRLWPGRIQTSRSLPAHLRRGAAGEAAAREYLEQRGFRCLTTNYRSRRGEIDLVCREGICLVFVEVKTRSSEDWNRPAAAVNWAKQRRLSRAALDYLKDLGQPRIVFRFDIVEVLMSGDEVKTIRHLPNAFRLAKPYRYG
jgi:putative endonuclease